MATSGILVKNAAVSLVNGVYNKYDDDSNGRRWLSSDRLCLMHFTNESIYTNVDVDLDSYVTAEMTTKRYYKRNTLTNEYSPIDLVLSSDKTINDQLGNTKKYLVANSLEDEPRLLTATELALGTSGQRIYWLVDTSSASDNKAEDFYVGPTMLQSVKTIMSRTKEVEVSGNVSVVVRFINLREGEICYAQIDGGQRIYAENGIITTTAPYGLPIQVCIKRVGSETDECTVSTIEHCVDRVVHFTFDSLTATLTNDNTYSKETYTAALYYTSPIYTLCESKNMNHWTISRINLDDLGLTLKEDLYYAFAETNDISPYDGLPWILLENSTGSLDSNLKVEYWDESSVQATTTTTTDPDGAVRTVTTFVNIITGETYTDTQVVREKVVTVPKEVKRYDYVNLAIGKIYRFRFASEFSKLGWIPGDKTQPIDAGIYKVDSIMSYYDAVIGRIDLFVNLYEPCGVSKSVFDDDKKRLANTTIYRLVDPNDISKIYFMPAIFIEGQPDASVLRYNKLLLMIDLGIQPNSETVKTLMNDVNKTSHPAVDSLNTLSGMGDLLKKVLEKEYGLIPTESNPLIKFSVYGETWLTDESYKSIEADRATIKARSLVDFNTLFNCENSNKWYLENQQLRDKNLHLEAMIQQILSKRMGN